MPATLTRPKSRKLRESVTVAQGSPLKVDRKAGIIYGVKILGLTSPNTHGVSGAQSTRYKKEALEAAIPLYEDVDVFLNHRERKKFDNSDDDADQKLGKLRAIRMTESGLRGDYYYLASEKFNEKVVEDAERGLGCFSFSHDANGEGPVENGVFLIERITEVRRVDIVSRGATNRNLWESHEGQTMAKITFRKLLESNFFRLSKGKRAWASKLLENDYMEEKPVQEQDPLPPGGMEVDAPVESSSPEEALKEGFRSALMAVLNDALDNGGDAATALKKIKELLTTHDKLTSTSEPPAPEAATTEEAEEEPVDDDKKEKEAKESLQRQEHQREFERLKAGEQVATLCESLKFQPTSMQRKALIGLQESERRGFIMEELAKKNAPRSSGPGGFTPTITDDDPSKRFAKVNDGKSLVESLRR